MKARRRRSRLILAFLVILAVSAALEGGIRIRQWARYGTSAVTLHELDLDPESGLRVPRPGVRQGRHTLIEVNDMGFRGPPLDMPKPDGRVRLAFLGGSTTFCAEVSSNEAAWPHLVTVALQEQAGDETVDFVNGGAGGYTVANSLTNLEVRVTPTEPDVIVIYHATNDLVVGTRELAVAKGLVAARDHRPSWLAQRSLAWNLLEKNVLAWWRGREGGSAELLDADPSMHAERFRENLSRLVAASQDAAPVVVLMTFSHKARREQMPEQQRAACASSLYYMPYMSVEGILRGFEAYNAVIRDVAADTGVILVEGEHDIPGDAEHFVDSVHFSDVGSEGQASRLLKALPDWRELSDRLAESP